MRAWRSVLCVSAQGTFFLLKAPQGKKPRNPGSSQFGGNQTDFLTSSPFFRHPQHGGARKAEPQGLRRGEISVVSPELRASRPAARGNKCGVPRIKNLNKCGVPRIKISVVSPEFAEFVQNSQNYGVPRIREISLASPQFGIPRIQRHFNHTRKKDACVERFFLYARRQLCYSFFIVVRRG